MAPFQIQKVFSLPQPAGVSPYVVKLATPTDYSSMAVATSVNSIVLMDPANMQPVRELCGHQSYIYDLEYFRGSPTNMISCGADGTARIWDIRAPAPCVRPLVCVPAQSENASEVFSCSIGAGDRQAAVSASEKIHIFDVGTGKRPQIYGDVHQDIINYVRYHPTDSDCIVSGADDNLICVTDTTITDEEECLRCVLNNEDGVRFFSFVGPERTILCTSSMTETIRIWKMHPSENEFNGAKCAELTGLRDHPALKYEDSWGYAIDVFYNQKDQKLLSLAGSADGRLCLMQTDVEGFSEATTFEGKGHNTVVRTAVSLAGNVMITGGEDGNICAWRADTCGVALESNSYATSKEKRTKARASPY